MISTPVGRQLSKRGCGSLSPMRHRLIPFILIALMVTMPWANVSETSTQSTVGEPLWSAAEAAENWYESEGSPGANVEISVGSGKLWVQTGPFDPLSDQSVTPAHLQATDDPFATGFLIVQLFLNDGTLAESLAKGVCLLYTSPSPRDRQKSRMPSSA